MVEWFNTFAGQHTDDFIGLVGQLSVFKAFHVIVACFESFLGTFSESVWSDHETLGGMMTYLMEVSTKYPIVEDLIIASVLNHGQYLKKSE